MKKIYTTLLSFAFIFFTAFTSSAYTLSVAVTDPTCDGATNGTATVTANGGTAPYTYSIDGGVFIVSNIFTGLGSGETHTLHAIDALGEISDPQQFTMGFGPGLQATVVVTPTTCAAGPGGSITITATNAVAPYTFSISNGYFSDSIITTLPVSFTNSVTDFYSIVIADAQGCFGMVTATIPEGDSLRATTTVMPPSCTGSDNGYLVCSFNAGQAPYQLWDSGWTTVVAYSAGIPNDQSGPFTPGTYHWNIQDNIGCLGVMTVVIPEGTTPVLHAGNDTAVCAGSSVHLSAMGTSSFQYDIYEWTPAATLNNPYTASPLASPSATTVYTVTYSDIAGLCAIIDSVTVSVINLQTPQIASNGDELTVTNTQGTITYTWQILNSGNWDDIATGTSFTGVSGNEYRVKASIGACEDFSGSQLLSRPASSNRFSVSMYPNPATDLLHLADLKPIYGWQTLEIISMQGTRVLPVVNIRNKTEVSVNIARLNAGIYIVRMTKADGETTELRIIKQ